MAHHNQWALAPDSTIIPVTSGERAKRHAAYTELEEIAPNRLLMIYDRIPIGWSPVPGDSDQRSRIFVLPISIVRT